MMELAEPGARRGRERGLETRIVGVALLSTITALFAAFTVYQWRNWNADRHALADEALVLANSVARAAHAQVNGSQLSANDTVRELVGGSHLKVAATYAPVGGGQMHFGQAGAAIEAPAVQPVSRPEVRYRGLDLEVTAPYRVDGRQVGTIALVVEGRELLDARLLNILIALVLSALAVFGAGLVARRLTRRALEPLRDLADAMDAATTSRDFSVRLPVARSDEVGRLTERFNRLLAALENSDLDLKGAMREVTAARDAAEGANRLKQRFLTNMSHELRTPLNGVLGMSQALLREPMIPIQRERVELIEKSGNALLTLLNEILDLADFDKGNVQLAHKAFDLEATIAGACETATLMAEDKGLALEIEISAEAAGTWLGDARRIHQMLYNLISNGLKFTASGRVQVKAAARGDTLLLSVTDTGIGIDAEVLPRLFEPFTQADDTLTRAFGGAGVGLTVCRSLADLMGGRIEVESLVGQGSVFSVALPLKRGKVARPAAPGAEQLGALRVLVAEDNEANQVVVRTVLNALGIEPVIVADGQAVVETWGQASWDLVLMDIQMPLRNGVEATREIRRIEAERGLTPTRIVALTANALPHQIASYTAVGMDGLVSKPIMIADLHAVLLGEQAA